jgi:hypothetical protein
MWTRALLGGARQCPETIAASEGYVPSQRMHRLIEPRPGWVETVGRIRQAKVRRPKRVDHLFVLTMAAYNLTRVRSRREQQVTHAVT